MKSPALTPRHRGAQTLLGTLQWLLLPATLALLFVGAGVLHVTSRVLVVKAGYQLSQLDGVHRALALENDRLKLELATLKNPARLERYARQKLGMGPPAPAAVLTPVPSAVSRNRILRPADFARRSDASSCGLRPLIGCFVLRTSPVGRRSPPPPGGARLLQAELASSRQSPPPPIAGLSPER